MLIFINNTKKSTRKKYEEIYLELFIVTIFIACCVISLIFLFGVADGVEGKICWLLSQRDICILFFVSWSNGIVRDNSKNFGTGHSGSGLFKKKFGARQTGRDIRDRGNKKVCPAGL
jgi:hypothetical protein